MTRKVFKNCKVVDVVNSNIFNGAVAVEDGKIAFNKRTS